MKSIYAVYAHNFSQKSSRYIIPQSVEIDLTNACNQDCVYCNVAEFRRQNSDVTKIHQYHKLIEMLASWAYPGSLGGVQTVTFVGGGEPTARKGYEFVVEQSVESGFLTSIVTNGTNLHKLINISESNIKKISWIGVDIDSGDKKIYDTIRRGKQADHFELVTKNIKMIAQINKNIDIKVLLHPLTVSDKSIENTFLYAKSVGARMLYFRLALMPNGEMYKPDLAVYEKIQKLSIFYDIKTKINTTRLIDRDYNKCYALYMMPVFSSDGKIYLCCENRGNANYSLGSWLEGDFRTQWFSEKHHDVFRKINAKFCKPCRPHLHNMEIHSLIQNEFYVNDLFL